MSDLVALVRMFDGQRGSKHVLEVGLDDIRGWHAEIERLRAVTRHEAHCNADRQQPVGCDACSCEAGREIKQLRHEIERLRAALRPFAVPAECWAPAIYANDPNVPVIVFENGMRIYPGHFDAARRALAGEQEKMG